MWGFVFVCLFVIFCCVCLSCFPMLLMYTFYAKGQFLCMQHVVLELYQGFFYCRYFSRLLFLHDRWLLNFLLLIVEGYNNMALGANQKHILRILMKPFEVPNGMVIHGLHLILLISRDAQSLPFYFYAQLKCWRFQLRIMRKLML